MKNISGQTEVIFGIHAVRHALHQAPEVYQELWASDGHKKTSGFEEIILLAEQLGHRIHRVSGEQLDQISRGGLHQGVVLQRHNRPQQPAIDLTKILESCAPAAPLLLVLDGIQDPHNLGACLRTANAAGVQAVIIPKNRSVGVNATVRKVACGAAELTPVITVTNLGRCLTGLKQQGIWILGADAGATESLYAANLRIPLAVVLGSEGEGLRHNTRQHCDFLVRLPMRGAVESLNVSVTAGICLYEVMRQRTDGH